MRISVCVFAFMFVLSCVPVHHSTGPLTTEVAKQGFAATFYCPEGSRKKLGVLVLGGAEGGKPDHLARMLAEEGHPVLSLAYFKVEGTPGNLDMIPLEYFDKPINWLKNNKNTKGGGIVVVGGSKGAELALLLASRKPEIKGVIALAPSSVVWQGISWLPRSSWSLNGKLIPFVPYDCSGGFDPNNLLGLYTQSLTRKEYVQKAAIEVEKIHGPILLLSGRDDTLWPSSEMGDMICNRLKEKAFKYKYEHVKYDDAGHTLNEYYMLGGTLEGNKAARIDSTQRMFEFLKAVEDEQAAAPEAATSRSDEGEE